MQPVLVFESALMLLFMTCRFCGNSTRDLKKTISGSFLRITQYCAVCRRRWNWESQPLIGTIPAGNILISAAILYAGTLPAKALRIFTILQCATITRKTFFSHQKEIFCNQLSTIHGRNIRRPFSRKSVAEIWFFLVTGEQTAPAIVPSMDPTVW